MCKLSVDIIRNPSGFCALRAECFAHATRTRRLRQRGNDRVVFQRKIYSKKNFFNHMSAIYYFINHYNQEILLKNNLFTT
jgi:hypothetical protein